MNEPLPFDPDEMLTALGRYVAKHTLEIAKHISLPLDRNDAVVREFAALLAGFQVMEGIIMSYQSTVESQRRRIAELEAGSSDRPASDKYK